jgi:hypothetical protein
LKKKNVNNKKNRRNRRRKYEKNVPELMDRGPNYLTWSVGVCGTPHAPTRSAYSSSRLVACECDKVCQLIKFVGLGVLNLKLLGFALRARRLIVTEEAAEMLDWA